MDWITIAVLVVGGLVLIGVDFYLPGFVLASLGTVLMLTALGVCYRAYGLTPAVMLFIGEAIAAGATAFAAIKYFPKSAIGRRMILSHDQTGVRAQSPLKAGLIGREGVAHTVLRPAGMAMLDGKRLDVVAESGMIERGSPIRVIAVEENRIVVRKV
jgi:membrane-bound serine protease (ClpP class)